MELLSPLVAIAIALMIVFFVPVFVARTLLPNLRIGKLKANPTRFITKPMQLGFRLATLNGQREQALAPQQRIIANLTLTPLEFLRVIEMTLQERQIPGVLICLVAHRELGLLSRRRWYLHIAFQTSVCIIGATPLGTTCIVSWRVGEVSSWAEVLLREHPRLHHFIDWFIRPPTFYRIDINTAFHELATDVVTTAIDQITAAQGIRAIEAIH